MSRSAPRSVSESIDGITRRRRAQMRLERLAVDHIYRPLEQTGDIIFQAHVVIDRAVRFGFELHQYVEVAVRPVVATRHRAEHGGVTDAARAQGALVAAKGGDGILGVHPSNIAQNRSEEHTSEL